MTRYGIIGIFGNRENGKTTYLARYLKMQMQKKTMYRKAFANIHIDDPDVKFITFKELKNLRADNPEGVPNMIVGIDQIHKYADSRKSLSDINKEMSDIVIESRQHGFDVIYTTWMRSAVDLRLRRFNELTILAQRSKLARMIAGGYEPKKPFGHRVAFFYYRFDSETGPLPMQRMTFNQAAQIWPYFNTVELVDARPDSGGERRVWEHQKALLSGSVVLLEGKQFVIMNRAFDPKSTEGKYGAYRYELREQK